MGPCMMHGCPATLLPGPCTVQWSTASGKTGFFPVIYDGFTCSPCEIAAPGLSSIWLPVERDLRARFPFPAPEETRPEVAFHRMPSIPPPPEMRNRHAGAVRVAMNPANLPAMPDPDPQSPQPPQPRPVSPERWLLLLTPSALAIAAPPVADACARAFARGERGLGMAIGLMVLILAIATALCFVLGFLLQKWRGGNLRHWLRPLGYGCLILIVNGFIAAAGCAMMDHR